MKDENASEAGVVSQSQPKGLRGAMSFPVFVERYYVRVSGFLQGHARKFVGPEK